MLIDVHAHVLPDPLEGSLSQIGQLLPLEKILQLRRSARSWLKPYTRSVHRTQTALRHLPESARRHLDRLSVVAPLPSLLFESTVSDLIEAMDAAGVDRTVIIAHPPHSPNEFILELAQENPRLIAAVNIPPTAQKPTQQFKKYLRQGARFLKLHPAADGEGAESKRYRALLKTASDEGVPVILHTGCIQSHLLYKSPEQGEVERFTSWFRDFPKVQFILAHMNFHKPGVALDLAENFENLWVDTSWQPAEMIAEAARRIGPERVLFATDWPLLGNNIEVSVDRVRDCLTSGILTQSEADLILGKNAERLMESALNAPSA